MPHRCPRSRMPSATHPDTRSWCKIGPRTQYMQEIPIPSASAYQRKHASQHNTSQVSIVICWRTNTPSQRYKNVLSYPSPAWVFNDFEIMLKQPYLTLMMHRNIAFDPSNMPDLMKSLGDPYPKNITFNAKRRNH